MSKAYSFDHLKQEAAAIGKRIGAFIISSTAPHETKLAVAALLPHTDMRDIQFADSQLSGEVQKLYDAVLSGSVDGPADQSTLELLLKELLVRGVHLAVAPHGSLPTPDRARETLAAYASADTDTVALLQNVFSTFFRNEDDLIAQDLVLQQPPKTAWDGPQPGLMHQVDARHRFTFSSDTGYLESILAYDPTGVPTMRVHYQLDAQSGAPARIACELIGESGNPAQKILSSDGVWVYEQDGGSELAIRADDTEKYTTPAGVVVTIIEQGTLWRQPRAQYLGRLKGFDPLRPFVMRTAYGVVPIPIDSNSQVIRADGTVFETSAEGLRRVGELVPEAEQQSVAPSQPITIDHEHVVVALQPSLGAAPELTVKIKHPELAQLLSGAVHRVVGRHPFFHEHIPEMIDVHGGVAAETMLRELERAAARTGLVMRVLKEDPRMEVRAALLHAHRELEQQLWLRARELEELLGSEQQQTLHYPSIRAWVSMVAANPDRAVADLRRMASPVTAYAT